MVSYNGGLHRLRAPEIGAEADVKRLLDECLSADGVYHDDLHMLDQWLGALSEDDFLTVADGEETHMQAVFSTAPMIFEGEATAQDFINRIYEKCI